MSRPLVTVLIDTYNHERFIEEAIASVLEQDFPSSETEIIVVDDGSTDRTPEIVRKFASRLRLIRKPNGGQASAFNVGIPEAQGEFIAFLDGDDWWARNKLSRAMETFEAEPELGFVGHGDTLVYSDGRQMTHVLREGCRFQANTIEGARLFRLRKSFLGTCRMTVRAKIVRQILPVPEILTIQADEYLFTLAASSCPVRVLPEPLFFYRLHDSNAFQMTTTDATRLRRKQQVLAALAEILKQQLGTRGVDAAAISAIIEIVAAEADQLRLLINGGWPWETVRAEWKIYEVMCSDAPVSHRVFKLMSLLLAVTVPPRVYYSIRQKLSTSELYLQARQRWLPVPEPPHVQKDWRTGT
jgi:glycosyltransferase involved in cell wall biosynthesis